MDIKAVEIKLEELEHRIKLLEAQHLQDEIRRRELKNELEKVWPDKEDTTKPEERFKNIKI